MKRKHAILIGLGLAIWLIETAFFGWNWTAHSSAERFWDTVSGVLLFWGIVGDILSGLNITFAKNIAENHDHMQADKLYLQIKKGATFSFGENTGTAKKDINADLSGGKKK